MVQTVPWEAAEEQLAAEIPEALASEQHQPLLQQATSVTQPSLTQFEAIQRWISLPMCSLSGQSQLWSTSGMRRSSRSLTRRRQGSRAAPGWQPYPASARDRQPALPRPPSQIG